MTIEQLINEKEVALNSWITTRDRKIRASMRKLDKRIKKLKEVTDARTI